MLPGLIDLHVHLATAPEEGRQENNLFMEEQLSEMVYSGITTVRDMTGNAIILADYKRGSERNQIPAPAIYYAAQFAGPEYFNMVRRYDSDSDNKLDEPWRQTITDTTDISFAIARAKGAGATGIKIYSDLSLDLIQDIVKEASGQGLLSWSHSAVFPASPIQVATAKVHSMSHAWDMMYGLNKPGAIQERGMNELLEDINYDNLDSMLKLMKQNNIILDATNYMAENINMFNGVKITKRAHELGVKVSTGTDWPVLIEPKFPLYKELDLLIEKSGFTNPQALYSATKIGAESIGLNDRGVIEVGKRADLIVTDKNPLEYIKNVYSPYLVIKHGNLYQSKIR